MKIIWYNTIESTNSAMESSKTELSHKEVWAARFQTAGRGQRGNVWSSAAGSNLTFSIYLEPRHIRACDQFVLSQAVSLGVCDYLGRYGVQAKIKWPNDIYVAGNKICGILIEHSVGGSFLKDTIVGIGLNLNQREFPESVPNPTSLSLETDLTYDVESELEALLEYIFEEYDAAGEDTAAKYLQRLYLKDEPHTFTIAASGEPLEGRITGVAPDGRLMVRASYGTHLFAFKEIIY